ncbi:MAG: AbrB/MazE/SpoVT family DNA-binding domain-containing protein [Pseudomonadota bacterium]
MAQAQPVNARVPGVSPSQSSLKVTQVGNSLGVILNKELLGRLKLHKGSVLHVSDTPGGIVLTPYDPSFADQVSAGREFMNTYRDTFRALAK